jgi:excisionase family DNA binding protein
MATDTTTRSEGDRQSVLDELMTAPEVAAVLQLRTSTVEDYARRGVLPSLKVGRHRRFLRSAIEDAIVELARYA